MYSLAGTSNTRSWVFRPLLMSEHQTSSPGQYGEAGSWMTKGLRISKTDIESISLPDLEMLRGEGFIIPPCPAWSSFYRLQRTRPFHGLGKSNEVRKTIRRPAPEINFLFLSQNGTVNVYFYHFFKT